MKGGLSWKEDKEAVEARKANAGKYALVTSCDLPVADVVSAYGTLLSVEDAFRVLKDIVDVRPYWHACLVQTRQGKATDACAGSRGHAYGGGC